MNIGLIFGVLIAVAIVVVMVVSRLSRDASWKKLAAELGAEFVSGGLFGSSKVLSHVGSTTVTLDTYSVSTGDDSSTTYTRLRAPFQSRDGFNFTLYRQGMLARQLDKALATRDIQIGDASFDRDFLIQATDENRMRSLLSEPGLRRMIQEQPTMTLMLRGDGLLLSSKGVVRDVPRLKSMVGLCAEMLKRLQK